MIIRINIHTYSDNEKAIEEVFGALGLEIEDVLKFKRDKRLYAVNIDTPKAMGKLIEGMARLKNHKEFRL